MAEPLSMGVVSFLDSQANAQVEALWAELRREVGIGGIAGAHLPHFSYHGAVSYDATRLETALRSFAAGCAPFSVRASGLGIFTSPAPVLYIPIVRLAELSASHAALWDAITPYATDPSPLYAPDLWMPHITLALGDVDPATLGRAVALLGTRSLDIRWTVDDLALMEDLGTRLEVRLRVALG